MFRILCIVFLAVIVQYSESARILGVFPTPSISHQVVFRALFYELGKRGHEVVLVTANPGLPKDRPKDNITEIDTSHLYQISSDFHQGTVDQKPKRGVVFDLKFMLEQSDVFCLIVKMALNTPEVQSIYKDKNNKFDLVITESLYYAPLGFAKVFNAPLIWFSSLYGSTDNYDSIGAPARHPLLYPNFYRNRINNLSLWEKFTALYDEYRLMKVEQYKMDQELQLAREVFEDPFLTIDELMSYVHLLFLNINTLFDGNRPVPPNVVHLGALHMQPPKELPKDLKATLDNSKRGVVYVSLGTNVIPSLMDADLLEAFLKGFEKLPYDILWKFDGDKLPWLPKNLKIQKWFPQRDLLLHPNIKAFVMQGGLQSTDEAIDAGVPLVVIPALGDQWYNAERFEQFGFGIKLDMLTLEADHIVEAVNKVIEDKSYRANIKNIKAQINDRPKSPLETAVWWTEYVLRHKGAKHLKSPTATISWSEYLVLDVVSVVAAAVFVASLVVVLVLKTIVCLLLKKDGTSVKKVKKN